MRVAALCELDGVNVALTEISATDAATASLTSSQRAEVEALKSDKRRRERTATYNIINEYIGLGLMLGHRADGAPYIEGRPDLHISVTHSRSMAAIAWSDKALPGIDIEDAADRIERVAHKFMSDAELAALPTVADRLAAWTVKEAVFKCAGVDGLVVANIPVTRLHESDSVNSPSPLGEYAVASSPAPISATPRVNSPAPISENAEALDNLCLAPETDGRTLWHAEASGRAFSAVTLTLPGGAILAIATSPIR